MLYHLRAGEVSAQQFPVLHVLQDAPGTDNITLYSTVG
jgi:hypothetical protein